MTEAIDRPVAAVALMDAFTAEVAVASKTTLKLGRQELQVSAPGVIGIVRVTVGAGGSGPLPGTAAGSLGVSTALLMSFTDERGCGGWSEVVLVDEAVVDPAAVDESEAGAAEPFPAGELDAAVRVGVDRATVVGEPSWSAGATGAVKAGRGIGSAAGTSPVCAAATGGETDGAISPADVDDGLVASGAVVGETAAGTPFEDGPDEMAAGAGFWLPGAEFTLATEPPVEAGGAAAVADCPEPPGV